MVHADISHKVDRNNTCYNIIYMTFYVHLTVCIINLHLLLLLVLTIMLFCNCNKPLKIYEILLWVNLAKCKERYWVSVLNTFCFETNSMLWMVVGLNWKSEENPLRWPLPFDGLLDWRNIESFVRGISLSVHASLPKAFNRKMKGDQKKLSENISKLAYYRTSSVRIRLLIGSILFVYAVYDLFFHLNLFSYTLQLH